MDTLLQLWNKSIAGFSVPAFLFGIGMLSYLIVLMRWHSDGSKFDFRAALLDPANDDRVSLSRLGQLTALVTSTSVVVYYAINNTLTEWMFGLYMAAWAGTYIANKWAPPTK